MKQFPGSIFQFGPRRKKRLLILLLLLFAVPVLFLLPWSTTKTTLFLPLLLWVNLVGLPLALIGAPFFEIHEFGAVPKGAAGYLIIVLAYFGVALFLSLIGKPEE